MADAHISPIASLPSAPSVTTSAASTPPSSLFERDKAQDLGDSASHLVAASSATSVASVAPTHRAGAALLAGLERSTLGQPKDAGARRWAHAVTSSLVGVASSLAAGIPAAFGQPKLALPGLALGAGLACVAPALGLAPVAAPSSAAANRATGWRRTLLRPELAVLALRFFANARHGMLMEPVGVGAHAAAQLSLATWPQAPGSFADVAAQNAAWILPEAARVGAMLAAETAYRQFQLGYVRKQNAAEVLDDQGTAPCNSLGASCAQPLYLTAVPGTHISFSAEQNFFWNNQVQSVEKQFADGIRLFLLEYFVEHGVMHNGHSTVIKFGTMEDGLRRLRALLDAHPRELIVIKLSDQQYNAPPAQWQAHTDLLAETIVAAGLQPYAIDARDAGRRNLGALLADNTRAIFVDDHLPQSNFAARWPGEMNVTKPAANSMDTSMTLLNAFTTYIWPVTSSATNRQLPQLWREALHGFAGSGRVPNLVAVNDYETSEVVRLARAQNRAVALAAST